MPLARVEATIAELLRADKHALKTAADLPLVFRVPVTIDNEVPRPLRRGRWGARWLTRLYAETHVRRQLEALRACVRLERLGTTASADRERLAALEEDLANHVRPMLGWRRVWGLATRLPTVAAALPVVWAASLVPRGAVSLRSGLDILLALSITAFVMWIMVVWPAVKLGFRVKRAIFAGGRVHAHPFLKSDEKIEWSRFARAAVGLDREGAMQVYDAEDAAFGALGRRKPAEVPLDMVLSFVPYITFAVAGLTVLALVDGALKGFEGIELDSLVIGIPVMLGLTLLPFALVKNAFGNYRERRH